MPSPIVCQICGKRVAAEVALFASGDFMALCPDCLDEAEEFIVSTGCL